MADIEVLRKTNGGALPTELARKSGFIYSGASVQPIGNDETLGAIIGGETSKIAVTNNPGAQLKIIQDKNGAAVLQVMNMGQVVSESAFKADAQAELIVAGHQKGQQKIAIDTSNVQLMLFSGHDYLGPQHYDVTISPKAEKITIDRYSADPAKSGSAHYHLPAVNALKSNGEAKNFIATEPKGTNSGQNSFTYTLGNTKIVAPVYPETDPRSKQEFSVTVSDPKNPQQTVDIKFRGGIPVDPKTNKPVVEIKTDDNFNSPDEPGRQYTQAINTALEKQISEGGINSVKMKYTQEAKVGVNASQPEKLSVEDYAATLPKNQDLNPAQQNKIPTGMSAEGYTPPALAGRPAPASNAKTII